jgi:hypothetical protein
MAFSRFALPGGGLACRRTAEGGRVETALRKAVLLPHRGCQPGGYLWEYSGDLKLREAEGKVTSRTVAWCSLPERNGRRGVPRRLGYGDRMCLDAAREAAGVLVRQMRTGGWAYSVDWARPPARSGDIAMWRRGNNDGSVPPCSTTT